MKKILNVTVFLLLFCSCGNNNGSPDLKVTKKTAVWKNSLIEFRTDRDSNGKRNDLPTFQVAVNINGKMTGLKQDNTALGYGASAPQGTSGLYASPKGFSSVQLLSRTPDRMDIHLGYDKWYVLDTQVALDKQVSIFNNNPVIKVIDFYSGDFDLLNVSAGMPIGYNGSVSETDNGYIIKYSNGVTAVIVMPNVEQMVVEKGSGNVFLKKEIAADEPLYYYIGFSDQGSDYLLEQLAKIM